MIHNDHKDKTLHCMKTKDKRWVAERASGRSQRDSCTSFRGERNDKFPRTWARSDQWQLPDHIDNLPLTTTFPNTNHNHAPVKKFGQNRSDRKTWISRKKKERSGKAVVAALMITGRWASSRFVGTGHMGSTSCQVIGRWQYEDRKNILFWLENVLKNQRSW